MLKTMKDIELHCLIPNKEESADIQVAKQPLFSSKQQKSWFCKTGQAIFLSQLLFYAEMK